MQTPKCAWERGVCGVLCVLLLVGCGPDGMHSSGVKGEVEFDHAGLMHPGVAFDAVFERVRGDNCTRYETLDHVTTAAGQSSEVQILVVQKQADLARLLDVSAAAQLSTLAPLDQALSAKAKFAAEHAINRFSVYLLVRAKVVNATFFAKGLNIEDKAKTLFKEDLATFREQCGDSYVAGFTTGGEYYGILEVKTASDEERNNIEAGLAASGLLEMLTIKAEADIKSVSNALKNVKSVRMWSFQRGGSGEDHNPVGQNYAGIFDPQFFEAMIKQALRTATHVSDESKAVALTASLKDYRSLDGSLKAEDEERRFLAKTTLSRLSEIQQQLQEIRSEIDYALDHGEQFSSVEKARLKKRQNEVENVEETLRSSVYACYYRLQNQTACTYPKELDGLELDGLKRQVILPSCESERIWRVGDQCRRSAKVCLEVSAVSEVGRQWRRIECP